MNTIHRPSRFEVFLTPEGKKAATNTVESAPLISSSFLEATEQAVPGFNAPSLLSFNSRLQQYTQKT